MLRAETETDPPLGRPYETYGWRGFDVAYTTVGDRSNPDLLLCHGINAAGSSAEFRYVVDALAETYHVSVPDLPGFGASDRPLIRYDGELYVDCIGEFIRDRTDRPIIVASSLSGAYTAAAIDRYDLDIEQLVLICPTARTIPGRRGWLRSLVRSPILGEAIHNVLVLKPAIRYFLADHGVTNPAVITDEWVDDDWESAHRPGARFATASFLGGFFDLECDLGALLDGVGVPTTLLWGADATRPPRTAGRELAERGGCRLVVFENAKLLLDVEHPEAFVRTLRWIDGRGQESSIDTGAVDGGP